MNDQAKPTRVSGFSYDGETLTLYIRRPGCPLYGRKQPALDDIPADYREAIREWLGWPTKNQGDLR